MEPTNGGASSPWTSPASIVALDIPMPGHREIVHELVLESSPHFEQFDFVAFPVRGFGGHTRIAAGQPFEFSSKYATRIYALERGAEAPQDREALAAIARASGDIPVQEVSSVALASPVESVLTRLRIESIGDGALRFEVLEQRESLDLWLPGAFAIAVAATLASLAAVLWLRRRVRSSSK